MQHHNARVGYLSPATHGKEAFHPWVLNQNEVWVDRAGGVHEVAKLHPEYALNILLYLYERHREAIRPETQHPLVQALRARILPDVAEDPDARTQAPSEPASAPQEAPHTWTYPVVSSKAQIKAAMRTALIDKRNLRVWRVGDLPVREVTVVAVAYSGESFRYHPVGNPLGRQVLNLSQVRSVQFI